MNIIQNLAMICIAIISVEIHCMEEIPNYSDQSKYLPSDINFEDNYPDIACGCQIFLNCSLNKYITTKLASTVDNNETIPYQFKDFISAIGAIDNQIKDAKITYLADVIKRNPPQEELAVDPQFKFLEESPTTCFIFGEAKLPTLELIDINNPALNALFIIHCQNFTQVDWNQMLPTLTQGCKLFFQMSPQEILQDTLDQLDQSQLAEESYKIAAFCDLQNIIKMIQKHILNALEPEMKNMENKLREAEHGNLPIDETIMPIISYVIHNRDSTFINARYKEKIKEMIQILSVAIGFNRLETIKSFVKNGLDLNSIFPTRSGSYGTLESLFRKSNSLQMFQLLLDAGMNPDIKDNTGDNLLNILIKKNFQDGEKFFNALIKAGADVNITDNQGNAPLHNAIKLCNKRFGLSLIRSGANINALNNQNETPLQLAAMSEDIAFLNLMVDVQTEQAVKDDLLLHAIKSTRTENSSFLLKIGANPNCLDNQGKTPLLIISSRAGDYKISEMAELLIDANADVTATDNFGYTSLHYASMTGHKQLILLLLNARADVNATTHLGDTPLHLAMERGCLTAGKYLLNGYANVVIVNNKNQTPINVLSENLTSFTLVTKRLQFIKTLEEYKQNSTQEHGCSSALNSLQTRRNSTEDKGTQTCSENDLDTKSL